MLNQMVLPSSIESASETQTSAQKKINDDDDERRGTNEDED
jgi:hypothetical protein